MSTGVEIRTELPPAFGEIARSALGVEAPRAIASQAGDPGRG